jgi:amino acid transporter
MNNHRLSVFTLAMLITVSIDSIRNLPTMALFGSSLIFFFIFSAIVFLIPLSLVCAELSSTWSEKGGVYYWVKMAFGEKTAFLAVWLQWINTMVWFPTILSFIAATLAYLIYPNLMHSKMYLVTIILVVFWFQTLMNLKGVETSAKFATFCAIIGMIIPMILIIGLAGVWLWKGLPLQIPLNVHSLLPPLHQSQSWISLTAIMTAFLGIELTSVHVAQVKDPQKNFPKALLISAIIILVTMIFGSLAIAIVLPEAQISLVGGIMQAFESFLQAYHLTILLPILTIMILIGSVGLMTNWVISPAKGLMQAAQNQYLPAFFRTQNKHGVAQHLLIVQAILVSVICLAFLLMPSVNGSYWLLTDLSTQLYMVMYVILFAAALVLKYKKHAEKRPFAVPFKKPGMWVACSLGIIGCIITLIVGFIPPSDINVGTPMHYEFTFCLGMVALILPAIMFIGVHELIRKK